MLNRNYLLIFTLLIFWASEARSQVVGTQGALDPGRIKPEKNLVKPSVPARSNIDTGIKPANVRVPEQARQIKFILKRVEIEGVTVFKPEELQKLYSDNIGKKVSAEIIWQLAERVTAKYRDAGYFLSRAYVPAQSIKDGGIKIKIVEGYIADVEFDSKLAKAYAVKQYIKKLKLQKPVSAVTVESFLLSLNDMPGVSIKGILSTSEKADEAAAKLTLVPIGVKKKGVIALNNYGSRFLGPNQGVVSYTFDTLPLQQTTISLSSSLPSDEVKYAALTHKGQITSDIGFSIDGSITKARPGFSLKPFEIDSTSTAVGFGFDYKAIRQREETLTYDVSFDARKTKTDLLNSEIVDDNIRAFRSGVNYSKTDSLNGNSLVDIKFSQGLNIFGASDDNSKNLSRSDTKPDFTKIEAELSRLQQVDDLWSAEVSIAGQAASNSLYSSEEFGFGGPEYGRAYDPSDITGDSGLASSVELRYNKYISFEPVGAVPYIFYDIGKVWNRNSGQPKNVTASSVGLGSHIILPKNIKANVAVAFPIEKDISSPIYGGDKEGPRILVQILNEF